MRALSVLMCVYIITNSLSNTQLRSRVCDVVYVCIFCCGNLTPGHANFVCMVPVCFPIMCDASGCFLRTSFWLSFVVMLDVFFLSFCVRMTINIF